MDRSGPSTRTEIRDFLIFQLKLVLDGAKDVLLFNLAVLALLADLALPGRSDRPLFYGVLEMSERFDLWLNLHAPSREAADSDDGLFGVSEAGSPTLLGFLEQLVRGGDRPRRSAADEGGSFRNAA